MEKEQIKRLEIIVKQINAKDMPIPPHLLGALRQRYGLAAEYMAKILSLSEVEFREFMDDRIKETNINLTEESQLRKVFEELYERHHHHWGGGPCESIHWSGI